MINYSKLPELDVNTSRHVRSYSRSTKTASTNLIYRKSAASDVPRRENALTPRSVADRARCGAFVDAGLGGRSGSCRAGGRARRGADRGRRRGGGSHRRDRQRNL